MPAPLTTFLPFDRWLPDAAALNNTGLRRAWGVVPFYGNYLVSPGVRTIGSALAGITPHGWHLHQSQSATLAHEARGYYGDVQDLFEVNLSTGAATNRTRTVGGNYSFGSFPRLWKFHSFGKNVVATNYNNKVQFLATPGSGNFADMITSTFAPQARFVFSIRQNLFLANCFLLATYDGLPAGANPQLVAWSQSKNIQAFGSLNADPQLVGAGYNDLLNDFGPITAAIGGDFGIVFQRSGHVRIDGPPYEFQEHPEGGCLHYESVVRVGDDVYFWGSRGPSVLRGGNPPVEVLADGGATRSVLDTTSGFSEIAVLTTDMEAIVTRRIHVAVDETNGIIRWSYQPFFDPDFSDGDPNEHPTYISSAVLDYNYIEDRLGVANIKEDAAANDLTNIFGLASIGPAVGDTWKPFLGTYGLRAKRQPPSADAYHLFDFDLATDPKADVVFWTGLGRLSDDTTSRIQRVRPIYAKKPASAAVTTTATISSVNDPKDDEVFYGPFPDYDDMGWLPTPTTKFADYHSVQINIDPDATGDGENIFEIEGVEVEYIVSESKYGA